MLDNLINSGALWAMDEWLENNGENLKAKIPDGLKYSKEVVGKGKTYFIPVEVQTMNIPSLSLIYLPMASSVEMPSPQVWTMAVRLS